MESAPMASHVVFEHQHKRLLSGQKKILLPQYSTRNIIEYWPIFEIFFTVILSTKFAIKRSLYTSPYLKRVATLSCAISGAWRRGWISVFIPPPPKKKKISPSKLLWGKMTSERLFNSFIHPKNFYTPQKKFLATPLCNINAI